MSHLTSVEALGYMGLQKISGVEAKDQLHGAVMLPKGKTLFDRIVTADAIYLGQAKGHNLVLYAATYGSMAQGGFIGNLDVAAVKVRPGTENSASSVQLSLGDHRMIDDVEPPMVAFHYVNFTNFSIVDVETRATPIADGVRLYQHDQKRPIAYLVRQGEMIRQKPLRAGHPLPVEPTINTVFNKVVIRSVTPLTRSPGILRVNLENLDSLEEQRGYIRVPLHIDVVGPTGSVYEVTDAIRHRPEEVSQGTLDS